MIELTTGTPGAGKTLHTIQRVKAWAERENRPVRYSGIADLKLPWVEIDPEKWFEAEANSIVVIDECQRVFRPRSFGANVPEYVAKLETHRHQGIDLVFITQHPMLIDSNIRRLVGRHYHVARKFGMKRATVLEFESCKDNPLAKLTDATRHEWSYPKEAFEWYKSAEIHTHKARIPMRYWLMFIMPVVVGAIIYFFIQRHYENGEVKIVGVQTAPAAGASSSGGGQKPKEMSPADYSRILMPRVAAMPHTAAYYDEVTKPVRAPYPVGCIATRGRCSCYAETGVRYWADETACRQIMAGGFFKAWDEGTKEVRPIK